MSSWKNMKPLNKGIILIILSAFFFALMMMFVRLAGDLPSVQKAFQKFCGLFLCRCNIDKKSYQLKTAKESLWAAFFKVTVRHAGYIV